MLIDVVISTKNNVASKHFSLYWTIRSLLCQKPHMLQIVVADNGSEDTTVDSLRRTFGEVVGILDTSDCSGNLGASRNAAATCGHADVILFMDDDIVLSTCDTLNQTIAIACDVDFACGARRLWAPLTWPDLIRMDDPFNKMVSTLRNTAYEPCSVNRVSGRNILDNRSYLANFGALRRAAFRDLSGFDEEYTGWGYQDTDLMYRLCLAKYEYAVLANCGVTVYHLAHTVDKSGHYESNRKRFLDKQRAEGRYFHTNHFFEIYENDGYSLFTDFPEDRID